MQVSLETTARGARQMPPTNLTTMRAKNVHPVDPTLALYDAWRQIADEVSEFLEKQGKTQKAFIKEHDSLYPRIMIAYQPFYSEEGIRQALRIDLPPLKGSKSAQTVLDRHLASMREAEQRWQEWYEAAGLLAMDNALDEISERESEAYNRLFSAIPTTPNGVALKLRAALFYAGHEFNEDVASSDTMFGKGFAAALCDLERMGERS